MFALVALAGAPGSVKSAELREMIEHSYDLVVSGRWPTTAYQDTLSSDIVLQSGGIDVGPQNSEIVRSLYNAYVARDWDSFKLCIGDRCVWIDSRGGQHVGPEEVASYFQGWLASCSDESLDVTGFFDAGTTVVVEGVMRGTNDGPLGTLPATGRTFELPYCEVFHLADGRVARYRVYANFGDLMAQLGLG